MLCLFRLKTVFVVAVIDDDDEKKGEDNFTVISGLFLYGRFFFFLFLYLHLRLLFSFHHNHGTTTTFVWIDGVILQHDDEYDLIPYYYVIDYNEKRTRKKNILEPRYSL